MVPKNVRGIRGPKGYKNRLKPIKEAYTFKGHSYWLFQCKCGNQKVIRKSSVKHGGTKSCGCIYNPNAKTFPEVEPWNKGKFKIYKIPNDKTSPSRYVNMEELTMIYNGIIDEGF
jgi:hypothetical protein